MKPWIRNLMLGLGIPAALAFSGFVGVAILSHAEDPDREKRLSDVEKVAVQLGKIHEADEAARARTIEMCENDQVNDCRECKNVGVHNTKACKK